MVLEIKFVGLEPGEKPPAVALFLLDPSGRAVRKLTADKEGKLDIDPALAREALAALGPDVENVAELERNALLQFRPQERLPDWERKKVIEIPRDWWVRWRFFIVCVNGRVRRCLPILLDPITSSTLRFPKPVLPFPLPRRCWPICNGVAEIYERTCCCRPPILVDLPSILEKLRAVVKPILRWPPPPPPDGVRIEPGPAPDRVALREIKRAEAFEQPNLAAPPNEQLVADLQTLEKLQSAEAVKYLGEREYLWPIWCRCTSRKVGEALLGPDGRFHFCYRKFLFPNPLCRTTYFYKVRQWQDTQWVTIYDGAAAHRYFTAAEFADLSTFLGRACGPTEPPPTGAKPNVMLQDIGLTPSFNLASHYMGKNAAGVDLSQIGQYTMANPVAANAGLVNKYWASDAPWAKTLSLRLYFHPGLKALGAAYYRVSVVAADANGAPAGGAAPALVTTPVSWRKFVPAGGHFTVDTEALGPKTVGGALVPGLYKIPYDADAFWLGGQYHQSLDTTSYANGRHLVVIEVFDTNGNRLRPTGAADVGTDTDFEFQRWLVETGPDSTATVPFAALTHIFWFDNRACYADIEDLKRNHIANTAECQFMTGPGATVFSVGFRAFHAATADPIPAPATFMWYFDLWWHRGLNGPTVLFQRDYTNHPGTLLGGLAAESVPTVVSDYGYLRSGERWKSINLKSERRAKDDPNHSAICPITSHPPTDPIAPNIPERSP